MNNVFLMLAVVCAALLIESAAVEFISWILKPKSRKRMTLIPIDGSCGDIERSLRWQFFRRELYPLERDSVLLIVDCGIGAEDAEIAKRLCQDRRNCRLCKVTELSGIVGDDAVCKGVELVLY